MFCFEGCHTKVHKRDKTDEFQFRMLLRDGNLIAARSYLCWSSGNTEFLFKNKKLFRKHEQYAEKINTLVINTIDMDNFV